MKKVNLLTTDNEYWYFTPIGTGLVFTYHTIAKQVLITSAENGVLIDCADRGYTGYETPEEFKKASEEIYLKMIEDNVSMDLTFFKDPTHVGDSMVEVDFMLLKN